MDIFHSKNHAEYEMNIPNSLTVLPKQFSSQAPLSINMSYEWLDAIGWALEINEQQGSFNRNLLNNKIIHT